MSFNDGYSNISSTQIIYETLTSWSGLLYSFWMDDNPLSSSLQHQAIEAALTLRWVDAVRLNRKILKLDPQNVDALSRQAKAYLELRKYALAKKYYSTVLKSDPYNPIALKNLKILKAIKISKAFLRISKVQKSPNGQNRIFGEDRLSAALFLQEPGKTKVVTLLHVAEPQKLSQTYCGMRVEMVIRNRKFTIISEDGTYLGVLPDDICHKLLRLTRGGNKYSLFIKSIRVNGMSVLIKETYRSKRFKNQPSFLENSPQNYSDDMLTSFDDKSPEPEEETAEETLEA